MTTRATPSPDEIKPERIGPTASLGQDQKLPTSQRSFESYMKSPEANPMVTGKSAQVSPFDLVHGQGSVQMGPSLQTLLTQVTSAQTTLGDLNNSLNTPNLRLRQSQRYILNNKLSEASTHLRAANTKLGGPEAPEPTVKPGSGPIAKFLAFVADGESQLEGTKASIAALNAKGESLSAGDMMLLQLKINKAQQELEYCSILLSKAVSDVQTIFGIQI